MTRLYITVDLPDYIDPMLNEPEDVAESIIDAYTEHWARDRPQYPTIEFVSAEWT